MLAASDRNSLLTACVFQSYGSRMASRYVPMNNLISNLRDARLSRTKRCRRWERGVASLAGEVRAFEARDKPVTAARMRARLEELIAERCMGCGKFWHVSSEKHAPSCIHSERRA
jgi:hypothetical protein